MSKKVNIAIFPKIVLMIAAVGCFIDLFLPWAMNSSIAKMMPYSASALAPLVLTGAITLALNIIAVATKSKGVNKAGNIFGLIGGITLVGAVLLQMSASSMVNLDLDEYQIAFWMSLVIGIVFIIFSIISMATSRIKD